MKNCPNCNTANPDNAKYCKSCGCKLRFGLKDAVTSCFDKYGTVEGRASRSEFWYFVLFYFICALVVAFMAAVLDNIVIQSYENKYGLFVIVLLIFQIIFSCPLISVSVRRLHDIGLSGKWNIVYWILFVLAFLFGLTDFNQTIFEQFDVGFSNEFRPFLPFIVQMYFLLFCKRGSRYSNKYGSPSSY